MVFYACQKITHDFQILLILIQFGVEQTRGLQHGRIRSKHNHVFQICDSEIILGHHQIVY